PKEEIDKKVKNLLDEIKKTEKEKEKVLYAWIMEKVKTALDNPEIINGIQFFYLEINTGSKEVLRQSIDFFRSKVKEKGVFLVVLKTEGRLNLVLGITDDLVKEGLHAGNLIREVAKITGGGGGGKPYMGEAGGRNPEKLKDAVEFLKREISHAGD
ncbi:MAG TPA: hypothetical protein ENG13_03080, partial [bacterium]|nr:hypothetical protein [bacterium]HEX68030.1 hypothetical protein [bacterium]